MNRFDSAEFRVINEIQYLRVNTNVSSSPDILERLVQSPPECMHIIKSLLELIVTKGAKLYIPAGRISTIKPDFPVGAIHLYNQHDELSKSNPSHTYDE